MGNDQSERRPIKPPVPPAATAAPAKKPALPVPAGAKKAPATQVPVKTAAKAPPASAVKSSAKTPVKTPVKTPAQAAFVMPGKGVKNVSGLLKDSVGAIDFIPNEEKEKEATERLRRIAVIEAYIIVGLSVFLVLGQPLFEPLYTYYSLSPQKRVVQLVPLNAPNMTNKAVLSWASSGITELMTIGFGDFGNKMIAQKWRFTPDGWDAFVHAFLDSKAGETFKQNQLVLTTVPREIPVIVSQGENDHGIYQWEIQMPIVMTYATNNSTTKKEKALVTLTIVRSPESTSGIAIEKWIIGG